MPTVKPGFTNEGPSSFHWLYTLTKDSASAPGDVSTLARVSGDEGAAALATLCHSGDPGSKGEAIAAPVLLLTNAE